MTKERIVALIDGYNFYHPIESHLKATGQNLKWLDYRAMLDKYVKTDSRFKSATLHEVFFFTAIASWRGPESVARHQTYLNALRHTGVNVVQGQFKRKDRSCPKCFHHWQGHEEKETDVKIALKLLELAMNDDFDTCFLCSADSDMIPAVKMLNQCFPKKRVCLISPPSRVKIEGLKAACLNTNRGAPLHIKCNIKTLASFQLPDSIVLHNGQELKNPYKLGN